ncbi:MAG: DUF2330 domain-containing protein [Planctomycetes bacterium]|nr:DUF2330 domain-containing protein [Planctomycetota bacterium]
MKCLALAAAVASLVLLRPLPTETCCMVPKDYAGTIGQSAQEAVMFWNDGREELILRINYRIDGKVPPPSFAWIVTVPNEPDDYAVADADLFREVFEWAQPLVEPPTKSDGKGDLQGPPQAGGLEFGKAVKVGPFDIQPVRALGLQALEGLNAWLEKHGFPTEDPKHMEYFVVNKFTFLCIKVTPAEGKTEVESKGGLPPLRLSFRSDCPYYPLRFSSRQGVFDINLYVFTKQEFDYKASGDSLKRINWAEGGLATNVRVKPGDFPKLLAQEYGKSAFKDEKGEWHLNVLRTFRVNDGNTIAGWKEDIFFRTRT